MYFIDSSLVDNLNEKGSDYEGSGEKFIRLVYSLLPVPRSVRLSRLDYTIDRGALRNYFNILHQKASIRRPLLVDHIRTSGDGFAIIEFRTVEGKWLDVYIDLVRLIRFMLFRLPGSACIIRNAMPWIK